MTTYTHHPATSLCLSDTRWVLSVLKSRGPLAAFHNLMIIAYYSPFAMADSTTRHGYASKSLLFTSTPHLQFLFSP